MIEYEEPEIYNEFMRELRKNLLVEEDEPGSWNLGGERRALFFKFRGEKLGLIDRVASEASEVSPEEAARFYDMRSTEMAVR